MNQPTFTTDKAIFPFTWSQDYIESFGIYLNGLEESWQSLSFCSAFLDLDLVIIFDTDDQGYYRFEFKWIGITGIQKETLDTISRELVSLLEEDTTDPIHIVLENKGNNLLVTALVRWSA